MTSSLLLLLFAPALSAQIDQFGVQVTNYSLQNDAASITRYGSSLHAFIEGEGITATSPISSASFSGPTGSFGLDYEGGRWSYFDGRIGPLNPTAVHFLQGSYTFNAGGDAIPLDLSGNFPNFPLVTASSAGTWRNGILILTAEEAANELLLTTNASTGEGTTTFHFERLESAAFDLTSGDFANLDHLVSYDAGIASVNANALTPGAYAGEFQFDNVLDVQTSEDNTGSAFAIASASTFIRILVEPEYLETTVVWTGPKEGRFNFRTKEGFTYTLVRSGGSSLGIGSYEEVDKLTGDGENASLAFDDSSSSDPNAFFHVVEESGQTAPDASAFATLVEGKTILGINFTPENRWDWFGLQGDWTYELTSPQEVLVTLEWDDSPESEDFIALDFGTDGDAATIDYEYSFLNDGNGQLFLESGQLDLTQDSFAPIDLVFPDLLEGQTYLGYTFTSSSRFIWNGEPGEFRWQRIGDDQIKLTFTYDEDGNDPSLYREEVTLTFNGTNVVPVHYELYISDILDTSQNAGTVILDATE